MSIHLPTDASERQEVAQAWAESENEQWRGRAISRIRTRITRNGMHMAFVAIFAVLGGAVRGFNLLVILAGLMVGILIMQWRFCRGMLPGLTVMRQLPNEAFAGAPFRVRFILTNHRSWLPAWLVQLEDRIRGARLPARGASARCSVAIAHPQQHHATHYECVIEHRGRYRFGPLRLSSGFPFGLINAWKNTRTHTTFTVFPKLAQLNPTWSSIIENRREGLAAARNSSGPNEGEFFGIRGWQTGDSQRWIHWRTSARIGELAVRQFEQRNRTQLSVILDPFCGSDEEQDLESMEWAVSVAASMVVDVASTASSRIAFAIADDDSPALHMRRVRDFSQVALTQLATVKSTPKPSLERAIAGVLAFANPTWPIVIVSPRASCINQLGQNASQGDGALETNGGSEFQLPTQVLNRLDLIWLDVTHPASNRIAHRAEVQHATH